MHTNKRVCEKCKKIVDCIVVEDISQIPKNLKCGECGSTLLLNLNSAAAHKILNTPVTAQFPSHDLDAARILQNEDSYSPTTNIRERTTLSVKKQEELLAELEDNYAEQSANMRHEGGPILAGENGVPVMHSFKHKIWLQYLKFRSKIRKIIN